MSADREGYAGYIARAQDTPGGRLSIGRGGFEIHYKHGRLSGYACDRLKDEAIAAGLPVIDNRNAPFDLVARPVVKGSMIAVNEPPSPRPWQAFLSAPLADVAAAYRAIGADIHNIKPTARETLILPTSAEGPLGNLLDAWLTHFTQHEL
jgi:hypothetical protein